MFVYLQDVAVLGVYIVVWGLGLLHHRLNFLLQSRSLQANTILVLLGKVRVCAEELLPYNLDLTLLVTEQTAEVFPVSWQAADSQGLLLIAMTLDRVRHYLRVIWVAHHAESWRLIRLIDIVSLLDCIKFLTAPTILPLVQHANLVLILYRFLHFNGDFRLEERHIIVFYTE